MKLPGLKLNEIGRNRGGELRFTALLCLTGSLLLGVFIWSDLCFGRRDTLSRYVPAQAAVYLHAERGIGAPGWAADTLALPENVAADEIARFAIVNGDGSLSWGAIFRWRGRHRPTDADRGLLEAAGATAIDFRTYLVGDDKITTATLSAWGNNTSLADDPTALHTLAIARGLADLQAYVTPGQLPRDPDAAGPYLFQEMDAFAMAASKTDGRLRLTAISSDLAANMSAWLGAAAGDDATRGPRTPLPPGAEVSIRGRLNGLDLHPLLFQKIDDLAAASPLSDPTFARPAKAELNALMAEFDAVATYGSTDRQTAFYASCSSCRPQDVADRIRDYANAAVPERRIVELPDKDTLSELVYSDQTVRWEDLGVDGTMSLSVNGDQIGLYLGSASAAGKAVLTNEPGLLAPNTVQDGNMSETCALTGRSSLELMPATASNMIKLIFGGRDFGLNKSKNVIVAQTESGLLITCGYIGGNVDK